MGSCNKEQNESALACAARAGDKEALQQLLERNWAWLKGLAYNTLGGSDDIDEAMQEVCLLVLNKIETLREPERFKGWLATVAKHRILAFRQQRSGKPIQLDELLVAEQVSRGPDDVVEKLARREQYEQVLSAMSKLPEKYREVFILKHLKDASYAEIGEILEIPITTVQIRLVRARRMIYNRLTGQGANKVPRT